MHFFRWPREWMLILVSTWIGIQVSYCVSPPPPLTCQHLPLYLNRTEWRKWWNGSVIIVLWHTDGLFNRLKRVTCTQGHSRSSLSITDKATTQFLTTANKCITLWHVKTVFGVLKQFSILIDILVFVWKACWWTDYLFEWDRNVVIGLRSTL